ncbi:MAG: FAD-dependent oxidoreductase [Rhodothermales bacterium]
MALKAMSKHVVIIGNGIAGVTAARFIRKLSGFEITMISDETDFFYSRTALMYIYMGHMRFKDTKPYEDWFWEKNRIRTVRDVVDQIDASRKSLSLRSGREIGYDVLIVATGSRSNKLGWPGQDLAGVQGLYGMPDLERMEVETRGIERAVVVGGGLIGIEMAEMLHSRHIPVTFLVREAGYMDYVMPPEESAMIDDEILRHGIDLRLSTELKEILGDDRVRSVVTSGGEGISCGFVGLTVGVRPNIDAVHGSEIEANRGVLVNEYFETSMPDVYAVGDCAEFRKDGVGSKRVEQLWYTGRMHGGTVARTICGERTVYDPGPFFNSAKFFTIEWQTYGNIAPAHDDGIESILWQEGRRLVRIDHDASRVRGFNLMGVRFRHAVCERWLREERSIDYVLEHISEAGFDPEFERRIERNVSQKGTRRGFFGQLFG